MIIFFDEVGLTYIYPKFPNDKFARKIYETIKLDNEEEKQLDILQTFAPNLDRYYQHLIKCINNEFNIRILLAWPYSEAAKLRENVLKIYTNSTSDNDINIQNAVIENLETLEKVIKISGKTDHLKIRLYDSLPSLAIYRIGNYLLAGVFLHGTLAVDTFQFELNLNSSNKMITKPLQNAYNLMWETAREFCPSPDNKYWRNDLEILFME